MSVLLGTLVAGVSWLAHETHAVAYESGSPTVISQVAKAVLGDCSLGQVMFFVVQLATMLILWTGADTPFNGFPFLANFVAADGFLPRWLTKRGHRLAFSNGIIVLTSRDRAHPRHRRRTSTSSSRSTRSASSPVHAGRASAMARYFTTHREGRWRAKVAVNTAVGPSPAPSSSIFAVTKFTEGAWLVVVVFPLLVVLLLRLRRTYQEEAALLKAVPDREITMLRTSNTVLILVDKVDLAVLRAHTYARSLRPASLRAVHFSIDVEHARALQQAWDDMPGWTFRWRSSTAPTDGSAARRWSSPNGPCSPVLGTVWSPCSSRDGSTDRSSGGCCTTAPRTRSPPRSPRFAGSRRRSSRSTRPRGRVRSAASPNPRRRRDLIASRPRRSARPRRIGSPSPRRRPAAGPCCRAGSGPWSRRPSARARRTAPSSATSRAGSRCCSTADGGSTGWSRDPGPGRGPGRRAPRLPRHGEPLLRAAPLGRGGATTAPTLAPRLTCGAAERSASVLIGRE